MGDDQIVISSAQAITPETVTSRSFTSAFRGYHPAEVRQFLKRVSDEMAAAAGREAELRQALQEALEQVAHPQLDETTLTNILGEHAARLLAIARDTAASIIGEAQQQAVATLHDAEQRVTRMRDDAEGLMARRVAEADATAASIRQASQAEAEALIVTATQQGKEMVSEARAVRERMLGDLARRRRSAQVQIEQLRAARERLVAAYDVVRRTVDEATTELEASEPEARLAAEAAGRQAEEDIARLSEELEVPRRPELRAPVIPAPEPVRPKTLVAAGVGPPSALYRRVEDKAAPSPERPRLRPQTVADAVAGRMPLPAPAPPAPPPPPPAPPEMTNGAAATSELATSEVPAITSDVQPESVHSENVEELFARLRAGRPEPHLEGPIASLSDPDPSPPPPEPPAVDPVVAESALEARDDLLENLEAGLARALKRVLGDEQNEVLDRLRRQGASGGSGSGVLPDVDAQMAAYRDAASPWLQQAARAGVGFVSDPGSGSGSDAEAAHPSLDAQAPALAWELVEPLRERLSRALAGGADADDPAVVAESLRATYRQWKVQQVEECARHHVATAFSLGAFAATPDVATLQWLVDDDGHCPDCDDNALAGPTIKGQPFPTGQLHPPAHPGCRCLLVPVTPEPLYGSPPT
ncbi:MAG: DivIVA domain-containing protein [Acidimicrobiales bacterium]